MAEGCIRCGTAFERWHEHQFYCSQVCQQKGRSRSSKPCLHCGKEFYPYADRKETSDYCSRACHYAWKRAQPYDPVAFFHSRYEKNDAGCWIWNGNFANGGYGVLRLVKGSHRQTRAHRFSYELHKGIIPDGIKVCHACDTPACVNPDHLWLGTDGDNAADMVQKGRSGQGTLPRSLRAPTRKLYPDEVLAIRQASGSGAQLAAMFGVSKTTVLSIRSGKAWRSL